MGVKVTKVKGKGRRSRSQVVGQVHEVQSQGHKGQSRRTKVKVVLYPIDSREVRHEGVFTLHFGVDPSLHIFIFGFHLPPPLPRGLK